MHHAKLIVEKSIFTTIKLFKDKYIIYNNNLKQLTKYILDLTVHKKHQNIERPQYVNWTQNAFRSTKQIRKKFRL